MLLDELINESCFMVAFWNPNGGIMVSGRSLSKKEVALLKRNWSDNPQLSSGTLKRWWWGKIIMVVLILCS
jgi:hypothetical protein